MSKALLIIVVLLLTVTIFTVIAVAMGIPAVIQRPVSVLLGLAAAFVTHRFYDEV